MMLKVQIFEKQGLLYLFNSKQITIRKTMSATTNKKFFAYESIKLHQKQSNNILSYTSVHGYVNK